MGTRGNTSSRWNPCVGRASCGPDRVRRIRGVAGPGPMGTRGRPRATAHPRPCGGQLDRYAAAQRRPGRGRVPMPHVPAMDAAGELEQIGGGVSTDLPVGEHVMAIVLPHGAHAPTPNGSLSPAESAVRVPAGATDAEPASLRLNGPTVRPALHVCSTSRRVRPSRSPERRRGWWLRRPTGESRRSADDRRRGPARRGARQGTGRRCRAPAWE